MAAVDPLRLTRFFDSPPGRSPASLKRVQAAIQSAQDPDWYDDDYGWAPDGQGPPHTGLGDKFHEEGTRVIKLEAPRGSLLGSPPAKTLLVRPVFEAEETAQDALRLTRPRLATPVRNAARQSASRRGKSGAGAGGAGAGAGAGDGIPALASNAYHNVHVEQPKVVLEKPVEDPGPGLMFPSQRRAIFEQEVRRERANKTMRKARLDKQRMLDLMRQRHPQGVPMMDSPDAADTIAYAETQSKLRSEAMRRAQRDGQRMATLAAKWDARTIRGYDPVEHTTAAPADPKQAKFMQTLGRAAKYDDTHVRIFEQKAKIIDSPARRQRLRNHLTQGRKFDIITQTKYTHVEPSAPTNEHKRLAHPSVIVDGYTRPSA